MCRGNGLIIRQTKKTKPSIERTYIRGHPFATKRRHKTEEVFRARTLRSGFHHINSSVLFLPRQWPSSNLIPKPFAVRKPHDWQTARATKSISASEQIFDRDKNSFVKLKEKLLHDKVYVKKFVAIIDGKIIDSDYDRSALAERVYTKHGYVQLFIGQVTKQKKYRELPSPERVKV